MYRDMLACGQATCYSPAEEYYSDVERRDKERRGYGIGGSTRIVDREQKLDSGATRVRNVPAHECDPICVEIWTSQIPDDWGVRSEKDVGYEAAE